MLDEGRATMLSRGTCTGPNVMYFETGQGSELSSEAHNGWDQVTMEARCYGFAKRYNPFLVNTVVGFIGPEYLSLIHISPPRRGACSRPPTAACLQSPAWGL